jgi:TPR repeat protein
MRASNGLLLALIVSAADAACAAGFGELREKAAGGDVAAQVRVAEMHARGDGAARDMKEAVRWFTMAAEQGNTDAQMRLGALYLGGRGLPKNSAEAAKWFLMAAEKGVAAAQLQIARMHLAGAGVAKDPVEAWKWASLAVALGDKQARPLLDFLRRSMTAEDIALGEELARGFNAPKIGGDPASGIPPVAPPLAE